MRESTVEAHLRKKATAAGALVRKMIWPGHRGAPDRLVIWPNPQPWLNDRGLPSALVDFVELKAPGRKPDPHQEREHEKLRAMGCAVYTLDSIEAVDRYIAERTS
jgi:hypothetical protein